MFFSLINSTNSLFSVISAIAASTSLNNFRKSSLSVVISFKACCNIGTVSLFTFASSNSPFNRSISSSVSSTSTISAMRVSSLRISAFSCFASLSALSIFPCSSMDCIELSLFKFSKCISALMSFSPFSRASFFAVSFSFSKLIIS